MTGTRLIFVNRNAEIAEQYKSGMTLEQVGAANGMTRERARQILAKLGVDKFDGGSAVRSFKATPDKVSAIRAKNERQEARVRATWNMSLSDYAAHIAEHGSSANRSSPMGKYVQQRNSAKRRGIAWEFTFATWWGVWQESGKWAQRGRGDAYVMARWGDGDAPYSVDTVYICTHSQNSKDSYIVSPHAVRFADSQRSAGSGKGYSYQPGASKIRPYVVHVRGRHIGQFATPEAAHAAYLQAWANV